MANARLEALLGVAVERATFSDVMRLIDGAVPEAVDLDFKSKHFSPQDPKAPDKFASDIAALANSQGGVLVIGIEEQNSIASAAPLVEFTDGIEQQMNQWVANSVFPKPTWSLLRVPSPADPSRGFVLCVVGKSRVAPHAVMPSFGNLKYPVRSNDHTRFLAEHEVAERYRARFVRGRDEAARLEQVIEEGRNGWQRTPLHFEAALTPSSPGELRLSDELMKRVQARLSALPDSHLFRDGNPRVGIGLRRLRIRDALAGGTRAERHSAQLHVDGSGYATTEIVPRQQDGRQVIYRPSLVIHVATLIRELTTHARDAGCDGDAALFVRLSSSDAREIPRVRLLPLSGRLDWRGFEQAEPSAVVESRLTITVRHSPLERMRIVRSVLTDFYQSFGSAEVDLIDGDGYIVEDQWRSAWHEDGARTARSTGAFEPEVVR